MKGMDVVSDAENRRVQSSQYRISAVSTRKSPYRTYDFKDCGSATRLYSLQSGTFWIVEKPEDYLYNVQGSLRRKLRNAYVFTSLDNITEFAKNGEWITMTKELRVRVCEKTFLAKGRRQELYGKNHSCNFARSATISSISRNWRLFFGKALPRKKNRFQWKSQKVSFNNICPQNRSASIIALANASADSCGTLCPISFNIRCAYLPENLFA